MLKLFFFFLPFLLFGEYPPELRRSSDPFVSGDGFRDYADHIYDADVTFEPKELKAKNTIFVQIDRMEGFFRDIHPYIDCPYILITHNGDESAPAKFRSYLDDPKIIAWFTENPEGEPHPKLHLIPIGMGNRYQGYGNPDFLQKAIDKKTPKTHLVYFNLTIQNHYEERWQVYQLIGRAPFCYRPIKKRFDHYLDDVAASKFVLAPRGVGLDTHRLWESLYLGAYPIVKTSPLDPLYEGLPVVVVKNWTEITEAFLKEKYEEMSQKSYTYEKLKMRYWEQLIDSYKR